MKITLQDFAPHKEMQFQPVEEDDDDLSNAIRNDVSNHDDNWQLKEDLDGTQLAAFWDDALRELGAEQPEE